MAITSNLKRIMREKGITYEQLQYANKIAPDTIARASDDRIATCKLLTLEKLAVALNVGIGDLFTYVPDGEIHDTAQK